MPPIPSLSEGTREAPRLASVRVPPPYDLRRTLACGQVFRWTVDGTGAQGVVRGRRWTVRQDGRRLLAVTQDGAGGPGSDHAFLWRHLAVDAPLHRIERALAADPILRRILPHTTGIAVMRQDPWECLISFVISAFNNIPKVRMSVEGLCRRFGVLLGDGHFTFPTPERLAEARLSALRACILGYRAPYVREVARAVADRALDLERLRGIPYEEAREVLLALPGVGEKVAECVLLFALERGEAFPVDVWIQRAMQTLYLRGRRASPLVIREWARGRFGRLAGYANQHLFLAARTGVLRLNTPT